MRKRLFPCLKPALLNFQISKFCTKIKIVKFGTKNALFECFGQNFWINIVISEVSVLECLTVKFRVGIKMSKFGIKNTLFGHFWAGILQNYCDLWNERTRMCLNAKFGTKIKILEFGTKNAWFVYFVMKVENNIIIFEISNLKSLWL